MLFLAQALAMEPDPSGFVALHAGPVWQTVEFGEPVWIDVSLEAGNAGSVVWGELHHDLLRVRATDETGGEAIDPSWSWRRVAGGSFHGADVSPGAQHHLRVDLAEFAWLDHPGRWTVEVGLAEGGVPASTLTVEVRPLAQPEAVVERVLSAPGPRSAVALGHAPFVPALRRRALDNGELRAVEALAHCPCPEAGEALVDILVARADLRVAVQEALFPRLIAGDLLPLLQGLTPAYRERGWSADLEMRLVSWARATLDAGSTNAFAAGILGRSGGADDADRLRAALLRAWAAGMDDEAASFAHALIARTEQPMFSLPPDVAVLVGLLDRRVQDDAREALRKAAAESPSPLVRALDTSRPLRAR